MLIQIKLNINSYDVTTFIQSPEFNTTNKTFEMEKIQCFWKELLKYYTI